MKKETLLLEVEGNLLREARAAAQRRGTSVEKVVAQLLWGWLQAQSSSDDEVNTDHLPTLDLSGRLPRSVDE